LGVVKKKKSNESLVCKYWFGVGLLRESECKIVCSAVLLLIIGKRWYCRV